MFYDSPHDSRKSMIGGRMNCVLWLKSVNGMWINVCNLNMNEVKELNVLAKEQTTKVNHKRDEQKEERVGKKVGD